MAQKIPVRQQMVTKTDLMMALQISAKPGSICSTKTELEAGQHRQFKWRAIGMLSTKQYAQHAQPRIGISFQNILRSQSLFRIFLMTTWSDELTNFRAWMQA